MSVTQHPHVCEVCGVEFTSPKREQRTCSLSCRGRLAGTSPSKLTCACGAPASRRGLCEACSLERKRASRRASYERHRETIVEARRERRRTDSEAFREERRASAAKARFNGHRQACLERDGFACTVCGKTGDLVVHHRTRRIDRTVPDRESTVDDLTTLCRACHVNEHREDLLRARGLT